MVKLSEVCNRIVRLQDAPFGNYYEEVVEEGEILYLGHFALHISKDYVRRYIKYLIIYADLIAVSMRVLTLDYLHGINLHVPNGIEWNDIESYERIIENLRLLWAERNNLQLGKTDKIVIESYISRLHESIVEKLNKK
jgi:hypothetical protein